MKTITCAECRDKLPAYLDRQLTPQKQQCVALHLQYCDACREVYAQSTDVSATLMRQFQVHGAAGDPQLSRMWANVQAEIEPVRAPAGVDKLRIGVAALVFVVTCVMPWLVNIYDFSALPMVTVVEIPQMTPTEHVTAVAGQSVALSLAPTDDNQLPTPTSTPQGAPVPGHNERP